jgi:hypothetical protein
MNLHDRRTMQRRPFQFGKLLVIEPNGAPEGAWKHIQVPVDAKSRSSNISIGSDFQSIVLC